MLNKVWHWLTTPFRKIGAAIYNNPGFQQGIQLGMEARARKQQAKKRK